MESGSTNNIAIVVRSLAALVFVLGIGLWPAPEGASLNGEPFNSLGTFLLYRYQSVATGILFIAAVVAFFYIMRVQTDAIARMHKTELSLIEERHRRELERREEMEKAAKLEREMRKTAETADLARALAGELRTCVSGMWVRIEAIHTSLAGAEGDASAANGEQPDPSYVKPGYMTPVIFPLVSEKLGLLGWQLAARISEFHAHFELYSATSFGKDGFRPAPRRYGAALLRHALLGAILQHRLRAIANAIESGLPANVDLPLDPQILEGLQQQFGVQANGDIDSDRWPYFASAETADRNEAAAA